jgi:hypothetical protein
VVPGVAARESRDCRRVTIESSPASPSETRPIPLP